MINEKQACAVKTQHVSLNDLPLSCPMPGQPIWNAHPQVYLPIEESPEGRVECPYCSIHYVLKEKD